MSGIQTLIEDRKKWGDWYVHVEEKHKYRPRTITVMHKSDTGSDESICEISWPEEEFSVDLARWIVRLNNHAVEAIETLSRELAELREQLTPRPIESAPKEWLDGRMLLAYSPQSDFPMFAVHFEGRLVDAVLGLPTDPIEFTHVLPLPPAPESEVSK